MGIDADTLKIRAFGEARPLLDAETDKAFRMNRRVEFEVIMGGRCVQ